LEPLVHFDGLPIQFLVALHHEPLEGQKAVDRHDLVYDFFVNWICLGLLTGLHELLVAHAELRHQFSEQILDNLLEVLRQSRSQLLLARRSPSHLHCGFW